MSLWRHLRAIGLLPGIGAGVVPALILLLTSTDIGWGLEGGWQVLPILGAVELIAGGLVVMYWTISLFATEGGGTLAPWDATVRLVVRGPYRWVRNPMICGVAMVLLGEAALFGSIWLVAWCVVFLALNAAFFPLVEEPALRRRFGGEYDEYARNVRRWIPRRRPWMPPR